MELSRFVHDFWNSKAAYRRFLQPNNVEALPNGLAGIPDGRVLPFSCLSFLCVLLVLCPARVYIVQRTSQDFQPVELWDITSEHHDQVRSRAVLSCFRKRWRCV